jgi:hypothetical protein
MARRSGGLKAEGTREHVYCYSVPSMDFSLGSEVFLPQTFCFVVWDVPTPRELKCPSGF